MLRQSPAAGRCRIAGHPAQVAGIDRFKRRAPAFHVRKNLGLPRLGMLARFKNEHRRPLAPDKTVAEGVEGPYHGGRIFVPR